MADYIYSLILLIIALIAIELRKSYYEIPKAELRHRAQEGDALAKKLYTARAYEDSLDALLWLVIILCAAGSLIIFDRVAPLWLDFIAIVLFFWLAFAWLPRTSSNVVSKKLAAFITPAVVFILNYVHPVFQKLQHLFRGSKTSHGHTGIYSNKDLDEFIDQQIKQPDSRIRKEDLELIRKVLKLSGKTVGEHSQSWAKIKHAVDSDPIGPVLLDELHKSGQTFVPIVAEDDAKKVVGFINLNQIDISRSGQIKDQMDQSVYYLREEDSLEEALAAMKNTGRPVFIVLDNKDRPIGIISLKDVLSELVSISAEDRDYTLKQIEDKEEVVSEGEVT